MKSFYSILAALIVLITANSALAAPKVKVVTTIFPLEDITRQVGGSLVEVHNLLAPGQGPHTFEPTPGNVKKIAEADIVALAGYRLEIWLARLLNAASKEGRVEVDCSKAVKVPIRGSGGHGHENPHYWLDPVIMEDVVGLIANALAKARPSDADYFMRRATRLIGELVKLDKDIATLLGQKGMSKSYVAFHNAWGYFARRYQLQEIGVIESAPGREPSAKWIAELSAMIKTKGVKSVLVEPQFSPRLGETLARETGARVIVVDPVGGVKERKSYIDLMRWNASQFAKALR